MCFMRLFFIKLEIISIEGRDPPNHLFSLQYKSSLGGLRVGSAEKYTY